MGDITVAKYELLRIAAGQHGYREIHGIGAFNANDQTGDLAVPGLSQVLSYSLNACGTAAANEGELTLTDTISNGIITPTSGKVTVRRGATNTSGLNFTFIIRGR